MPGNQFLRNVCARCVTQNKKALCLSGHSALKVYVPFVHFLATYTKNHPEVDELKIYQVAKACEGMHGSRVSADCALASSVVSRFILRCSPQRPPLTVPAWWMTCVSDS
jgi:hypothetical protein